MHASAGGRDRDSDWRSRDEPYRTQQPQRAQQVERRYSPAGQAQDRDWQPAMRERLERGSSGGYDRSSGSGGAEGARYGAPPPAGPYDPPPRGRLLMPPPAAAAPYAGAKRRELSISPPRAAKRPAYPPHPGEYRPAGLPAARDYEPYPVRVAAGRAGPGLHLPGRLPGLAGFGRAALSLRCTAALQWWHALAAHTQAGVALAW